MSKFKNDFDNITVGDDLKDTVRERIAKDKRGQKVPSKSPHTGKQMKTPMRTWKVAVITVAACLAAVMILPSFLMINNAARNAKYDFNKARPVKTESKLSGLLQNTADYQPLNLFSGISFGMKRNMADVGDTSAENAAPAPTAPAAASNSGSKQVSSTNVQVAGVDEGDVIKNDDKYIYRLSAGGFSIIGADNGILTSVCEIEIEKFVPIEMYVRGGQAVLIGGGYKNLRTGRLESMMNGGYMNRYYYHTNVEIRAFDITDVENPVETFYYQVEGQYHTSRIDKDGNLIFVVNYYNYSYSYEYDGLDSGDVAKQRPYCRGEEGETAEPMPIEDIYYFKNIPNKTYMILGSVDLDNLEKEINVKAYLSCAQMTYVSGESLYTSTRQWFYNALGGGTSGEVSYIAKFSLADLSFVGSSSVKGSPKDRYSLDEYEGHLRVATTYQNWNENGNPFACGIYIFDGKMNRTGRLLGLAKGEGIDSATFLGDRCTISTSVRLSFRDPLLIIDVSDVHNPKQLGTGLKEDGINEYLKRIGETDYVLGFGTDAVASGNWWNDRTGLKIQLYDMSGDDPVSKVKLTIKGTNAYAEVLSNPKALLYMPIEDGEGKAANNGYVGFAAESAAYTYENYSNKYTIYEQGLYLYYFDADAGTLDYLGLLSNFDPLDDIYVRDYSDYKNYDYDKEWQDSLDRYSKYVQRGIIIGDFIYTVAEKVVASYELDTRAPVDVLLKAA